MYTCYRASNSCAKVNQLLLKLDAKEEEETILKKKKKLLPKK